MFAILFLLKKLQFIYVKKKRFAHIRGTYVFNFLFQYKWIKVNQRKVDFLSRSHQFLNIVWNLDSFQLYAKHKIIINADVLLILVSYFAHDNGLLKYKCLTWRTVYLYKGWEISVVHNKWFGYPYTFILGRPVRALSLVSKDSEFNASVRPSWWNALHTLYIRYSRNIQFGI